MKTVRFTRDVAPYMAGELAGFDHATIERLGDAVVPFVPPVPMAPVAPPQADDAAPASRRKGASNGRS